MKYSIKQIAFWSLLGLVACDRQQEEVETLTPEFTQRAIAARFGGRIDMEALPNYAAQDIPDYIQKDNTRGNEITDAGAVLGRVLFYDKNLSVDNEVACASCHQQAFAFSDPQQASQGVAGTTDRHSMRLVNNRFADEERFFWDERAATLEAQTTQPIQNHVEMGFSGENGDPGMQDVIVKIQAMDYYQELFTQVYGTDEVTESRIQDALAQFIRSIQSFDTKYDVGRAQVGRDIDAFPNFSNQENRGKNLFMGRPDFDNNGVRIGGGLGCNACHRAPEFDIDPNSDNNGHIATLAGTGTDASVTRSPSLREMFRSDGSFNGQLMHSGALNSLDEVMAHYNVIEGNRNLDRRLRPNGVLQNLAMTTAEVEAVKTFLMTLSGTQVYVDERWSNPFESTN